MLDTKLVCKVGITIALPYSILKVFVEHKLCSKQCINIWAKRRITYAILEEFIVYWRSTRKYRRWDFG